MSMDKKDLRGAFDELTPPPELEERTRNSVAENERVSNAKQSPSACGSFKQHGQRRSAGGGVAVTRRRITAISVAAVLLIALLIPMIAYFGFNSTGNNEGGLRTFSSLAEVRSYVKDCISIERSASGGWATDNADMSAPESSAGGSGTEHSTTNVQVEGVAESDVVHTDGDYIYMLSYYSLSVIDIRAGAFKHVLDIDYNNFFPSEMYLYEDGNKLVVLGNMYTAYAYGGSYDKGNADIAVDVCCYWYKNTFAVKVYDIGEMLGGETKPERELVFDNCYLSSSRMIGGKLYLIMNAYSYSRNDASGEQWLPGYTDSRPGDTALKASNFYATPDNGRNYNFSVFAGIDVDKNEAAEVKVYFGSVSTLYASSRSFYITYDRYKKTSFFGYSQYEFLGLGVMRFAINGISLDYKGLGKVDGYANNQFAMDEYTYSVGAHAGKTFFRVATTGSSGKLESSITVLDDKMNKVGHVGGIGVGEQIYSVRFQGEQAVVVTYFQTDPLYVIDLSNPTAPKIKSELKIPGVSDYLHFLKIKDGYVFAVGRRQAEGGTWLEGIKVSLFDITGEVTDEVYYDEVTKSGSSSYSYSEATYNHKAILYFMPNAGNKEIFGVPVNIYDYSYNYNSYYYKSYSDLYYYEISADGSVAAYTVGYHAEKYSGAISNGDVDYNYYYYYRDQLRRSVIAGDKLYLVGYGGVERYDLNALPANSSAEGDIVTISTKYWER